MVLTDEQLIDRIAARDATAIAEFYDRHASRVLGLLLRMLPARSDAEDVLQEVFWQAWKTADRYDGSRGSVRTWLFLMARSRATDLLRRRKPLVTIETEEGHEPVEWNEPHGNLEHNETSEQVRSALNELPEEQLQAIRLSFYNGLAHKEIAQRLNIPLGTAKTRIRGGMKRMRQLLGNHIDEPQLSREATL